MAKVNIFLVVLLTVISVVEEVTSEQWYYECSFDGERHAHEIACNRYYECRGTPVTGYTIYLYKCPEEFLYNGAINTCQRGLCEFPPLPPPTTIAPVPETTASEIISEPTTIEDDEETTTDDSEPETEDPTTEEPPVPTTVTEEPPVPTTVTEEPSVPTTTEEHPVPTTTEEPPTTTRRPRPPFECTVSGTFVDTQDCNKFHVCDCTVEAEPEDERVCQDTMRACPGGYHFCEEFGICAVQGFCVCEAAKSDRLNYFYF